MSGEYVPHYLKTQARALLALARKRRIRLDWLPDESQLNDSVVVNQLIRDFNPPSDERFFQAKALASMHNIPLPPETASSKIACEKFIREHPSTDRIPTEPQKRTLRALERLKDIEASPECWVSEAAWERFVKANIDREDLDEALEVLADLQIPTAKIDLGSLGGQVYALELAKESQADKEGLRRTRVKEMLIAGEDPFDVALALNFPVADVISISHALEAAGYEQTWS